MHGLPTSSHTPFICIGGNSIPFLTTAACTSRKRTLTALLGRFGPSNSPRLAALTRDLARKRGGSRSGLRTVLRCAAGRVTGGKLALSRANCHLHPTSTIVDATCKARIRGTGLLTNLLSKTNFGTRPVTACRTCTSGKLTLGTISRLFISYVIGNRLCLFSASSARHPRAIGFSRAPLFDLRAKGPMTVTIPRSCRVGDSVTIHFGSKGIAASAGRSINGRLVPCFAANGDRGRRATPLGRRGKCTAVSLPSTKCNFSRLPCNCLGDRQGRGLLVPHPIGRICACAVRYPRGVRLHAPRASGAVHGTTNDLAVSIGGGKHATAIAHDLRLGGRLCAPTRCGSLHRLLAR